MKKLTVFFLMIHIAVQAYIPFNPIIQKGGDPLRWDGDQRKGVAGWLEVPDESYKVQQKGVDVNKLERVLMLKQDNDKYVYIHPENPDIDLPQGLFLFESGWRKKKPQTELYNDAEIISQSWKKDKKDLSYILQAAPLKAFWGRKNSKFQVNNKRQYDPTQSKYIHPFISVEKFFDWTKLEKDANVLDRLFFVHKILGVTEQYFRDFWGDSSTLPTTAQIKEYFPLDHKDFPEREVINQALGKLKVVSVSDLEKELNNVSINKNRIGKGKLILIDGYQIYQNAGGNFLSNQEKQALKGDKEKQQKFLDSDAAKAGREATDVRKLLADENFNGAVFQDAATRNLLEGGMNKAEELLTNMLHGPVQGEETSIATAGRSFVLKYFEKEYDILEEFYTKYDTLSNAEKNNLLNNKPSFDDLKASVQAGYYPEIAVTSGFWPSYVLPYQGQSEPQPPLDFKGHIKFLSKIKKPDFNWRIVGNIFNSFVPRDQKVGVALVAGHNLANKGQSKDQEALAKLLIDAAYELTLLLAVVNGKEKVILTLVGAGAFAGDFGSDTVTSWILDTLKQDFIVDLISKYGLEVTLINYPDLRPHRLKSKSGIKAFQDQVEQLEQLIEAKNKEYESGDVDSEELQKMLTQLSIELAALNVQIS